MGDQYIGQDLCQLIKNQADSRQEGSTICRTGLITSVNNKTYMAKVMLMPEGIETGWLPIGTLAAGPGWGIFHLPPNNTECTVDFADGSIDNGRIRCVHSNAIDAPPAGLVQGEFLLQHSSGSLIHFDSAGNINLVTAAGLSVTAGGTVMLTAQSDVTAVVSGDLTAGIQGDVTLTAFGDITAAALGDIDCTATGAANLSGTIVNITAATDINIIAAATVNLTTPGALTATATSLTATIGGAATIVAGSVTLGFGTTIDGVPFLAHTHSFVQTGIGVSGPVVP